MIWQHDGVWFEVIVPENGNIFGKDVISLTVIEKMGSMDEGQLVLLDKWAQYAEQLPPYTPVEVNFGINKLATKSRLDRRCKFYTVNSSGSGDQSGRITFNCGLVMQSAMEGYKVQSHTNATRGAIVRKILTEQLKISAMFVGWPTEMMTYSDGQGLNQCANGFQYLVKLANEWGCQFKLSYNAKGILTALFGDAVQNQLFTKAVTGSNTTHLVYGTYTSAKDAWQIMKEIMLSGAGDDMSNVLSYQWKNQEGNSMRGDGFRLVPLGGGEFEVHTFATKTESGLIYRLNPEKLKKAYSDAAVNGDKVNFLIARLKENWPNARDQWFDLTASATAPQGYGYKMTCKLMGNPTVTAGSMVTFGEGIHSAIGAKDRLWWVQKAQHSISAQGYFTDIEVVDQYAQDPTGSLTPGLMAIS